LFRIRSVLSYESISHLHDGAAPDTEDRTDRQVEILHDVLQVAVLAEGRDDREAAVEGDFHALGRPVREIRPCDRLTGIMDDDRTGGDFHIDQLLTLADLTLVVEIARAESCVRRPLRREEVDRSVERDENEKEDGRRRIRLEEAHGLPLEKLPTRVAFWEHGKPQE
jgi:hypothetical protein